jgi:hypothetical protein
MTESRGGAPPDFLQSLLDYIEGRMLVVNPTRRDSSQQTLDFLNRCKGADYFVTGPTRTDSITVGPLDKPLDKPSSRTVHLVFFGLSVGFCLGMGVAAVSSSSRLGVVRQSLQAVYGSMRALLTT